MCAIQMCVRCDAMHCRAMSCHAMYITSIMFMILFFFMRRKCSLCLSIQMRIISRIPDIETHMHWMKQKIAPEWAKKLLSYYLRVRFVEVTKQNGINGCICIENSLVHQSIDGSSRRNRKNASTSAATATASAATAKKWIPCGSTICNKSGDLHFSIASHLFVETIDKTEKVAAENPPTKTFRTEMLVLFASVLVRIQFSYLKLNEWKQKKK